MESSNQVIQINQHKIEIELIKNEKMLPLKSMCKALGIDYRSQVKRLKEHKILAQLMVISPSVGADERDRDMLCLSIKATIYWLLSINPNKAHEHFWVLQTKLYDAIVRDFYEKTLFDMQKKLKIEEHQSKIAEIRKEKWEVIKKQPDPWNSFDQPEQGDLFQSE